MKKAIASGLVGLIALGGGVAIALPGAIAQETDDETREERKALRQEARAERRAERVETLTSVLGVSAEELQAAKEDGQTVADVAAAQGVDLDVLVDALLEQAQARIDEKVAAGDIDDERAAEKLESLEERITARLNGERGERDGHRGRHHRGDRDGSTVEGGDV